MNVYVVLHTYGERNDDWSVEGVHGTEGSAKAHIKKMEKTFKEETGESLEDCHNRGASLDTYFWYEEFSLEDWAQK